MFFSTRTLSETEQSCPEQEILFVRLPDRGSPLREHCPRRNSPVRRTEALLSACLTEDCPRRSSPVWRTDALLSAYLTEYCPRRNSPVRSTESLLSAYLTKVLHNEDTVRDGTVLSGEWDSGPVQVRRTEGHVGRAVVVNQLDCDLKKENLSETAFYLSKSKVYARVNIHIYFSPICCKDFTTVQF
jgi:hypothetical protein